MQVNPAPSTQWQHYPRNVAPLPWMTSLVSVFELAAPAIRTDTSASLNSNAVLSALVPGLLAEGYSVEQGKKSADKLSRPVLFGANGKVERKYEVDAAHDGLGIVLEVEAGRSWANNAATYDLWKACMILSAQHLALAVPLVYTPGGKTGPYVSVKGFLDTLYASSRMTLPLDSVLLIGY